MRRDFTETVTLTTTELMELLRKMFPTLPPMLRIVHRSGYLSILSKDDPTYFVFEGLITKDEVK